MLHCDVAKIFSCHGTDRTYNIPGRQVEDDPEYRPISVPELWLCVLLIMPREKFQIGIGHRSIYFFSRPMIGEKTFTRYFHGKLGCAVHRPTKPLTRGNMRGKWWIWGNDDRATSYGSCVFGVCRLHSFPHPGGSCGEFRQSRPIAYRYLYYLWSPSSIPLQTSLLVAFLPKSDPTIPRPCLPHVVAIFLFPTVWLIVSLRHREPAIVSLP